MLAHEQTHSAADTPVDGSRTVAVVDHRLTSLHADHFAAYYTDESLLRV